jgi:MFS family permease
MKFNYVHFPFSPAKFPVYYGWIILFVAVIGMLMSVPGQTIGFSAFTEPLLRSLQIDRTHLSHAYLIGTLVNGLFIARVGRLYDRYGARILGIFAGLIFGVVLLFLSHIDHIIRFIYNDLKIGSPVIITFIMMSVGFFSLRFMGQGVLTMVSKNIVMKWFEKHRGLVNGILAVSISFGFSYSPRILDSLIQHHTWQGTWKLLALVIGVFFVLLAAVFFRDNPEECGLLPDGNPGKGKKKNIREVVKSFSLSEAKKTYSFWIFNLTLVINGLYLTALTFHVEDVFKSAGMSRETALSIFLPSAIIAVIFNFLGSALSDHIKLKYLLIAELAGLIITMAGLIILKAYPVAYWFIVTGNGLSQGMFGILNNVTWPKFYGIRSLGAISGYSLGWVVAGTALGPSLFSISIKNFGHYGYASGICLVVSIILFFMAFKADNENEMYVHDA